MCSNDGGSGETTPTVAWLYQVIGRLASAAGRPVDPGLELLDAVDALERLKAAAAALQMRVMVAFDAEQREQQRSQSVPTRRLGQGVPEQLALARRISPSRAARSLADARTLIGELPHTLGALATGEVSEYQAGLVVGGTRVLETEDRVLADLHLAGRLGPLGDREVDAEARRVAYRLDPQAVVNAKVRAEKERRVTVRPAPDCMEYVTGLVPMAAGVAIYKALRMHAQTRRAAGDPRTLDQIQADTFVERLTGQAAADAVPVAVTLVMTDTTLFGTAATDTSTSTTGTATPGTASTGGGVDEIADLEGYGPIPGRLARSLLAAMPADVELKLRRLFTEPATGQATAIDSHARTFTGVLREFITRRDQYCSTPYCGAPIRHLDHVLDHAEGGPTTADNGRGTCERCNYAKQAPGWTTRVLRPDDTGKSAQQPPEPSPGSRVIEIVTPTGRRYRSSPPPQPGHQPHDRPRLRARPA